MRKRPAPAVPELDRLDHAVGRLIEAHQALQQRAAAAEARVRELEAALPELAAGRLDPLALEAEVRTLRQRNASLAERLAKASAVADRMAGRLQFTAEEH